MDRRKINNLIAHNAIFLEDASGEEGRPFKSRFLQAGLVKYDFGVCLLQKETIDKFVDTFIECPVIIDHSDNISPDDIKGEINKIWFSPNDGWFWCSGVITDEKAVKLIEDGYNVSCQYRITDYSENTEGKLHNGNAYDKEILDGVFEHLAIVANPRYEGAFIAVNAIMADDAVCKNGGDGSGNFNHDGRPGEVGGSSSEGGNSEWTEKDYNAQIDKAIKGELQSADHIKVVQHPSKIWLENIGLQDAEMVLTAKTYDKATKTKHSVSEKSMRNLPNLINDPLYIFKSSTVKDSYVALLDDFEIENGVKKPLVAIVKPEKGNTLINIIPSVYGKDPDFEYREVLKGNLIYEKGQNKTASNNIIASIAMETSKPSINIIDYITKNFNPNVTIDKAVNKYEPVFEWIRNSKGETMDKETKGVFEQLLNALIARNEAEEDDEKKQCDDKAAENKAKNEEVEEEENAGNKAKNEDDDSKEQEAENEDDEDEDEKEKADNKAKNKCKNEDDEAYKKLKEEVDKAAENKKAKNALDEAVNRLYSALAPEPESSYISEKKGLELGKQIYG